MNAGKDNKTSLKCWRERRIPGLVFRRAHAILYYAMPLEDGRDFLDKSLGIKINKEYDGYRLVRLSISFFTQERAVENSFKPSASMNFTAAQTSSLNKFMKSTIFLFSLAKA